jgi:hypothetical protein
VACDEVHLQRQAVNEHIEEAADDSANGENQYVDYGVKKYYHASILYLWMA